MVRRGIAQQNRPRQASIAAFPAAIAGWISNQNLAAPVNNPQGAAVLENIFPTADGGIVRRGTELYATLGNGTLPVKSMFTYNDGNNEKFFAATENTIYDITSISTASSYRLVATEGEPLVTSDGDYFGASSTDTDDGVTDLTGGNWISVQFATTGGTYTVIVNGSDHMHIYDGSHWYSITDQDINGLRLVNINAGFVAGEVVTGATSGATATVLEVRGTELILGTITGGPFEAGEHVDGSFGGEADADVDSYPLFVGITGIDTRRFSYVWSYQNRLWFLEKDSQNAWYLPVDQVGGTATIFPMGGVFGLGGALMIGSSWSLGFGASGGLSDQCVFITDEGEVAVYQGSDPSSATDWARVGIYRIGKPLGPLAHIRAGGDLVVATDIGFVPLSQALQRDYVALSPSAVSYPIETAWNYAVAMRRTEPWSCIMWPERQMLLVALPDVNDQPRGMYVANARTGAWANFTNWNGYCMAVFHGRLFYGCSNGRVVEAYVTGHDEGKAYTATYAPLFVDLGNSGALKVVKNARATLRGPNLVEPQISCSFDYMMEPPPPPPASATYGDNKWGLGVWGTSTWGNENVKKTYQRWESVGGTGYAVSPVMQITSGSTVPLDAEIIRLEITFTQADIVT